MCVAVPAKVLSIGEPTAASIPAEVEADGVVSTADLIMVPDAGVGDYVVTHSGYAIRLLAGHRAAETLALLEEAPDRLE